MTAAEQTLFLQAVARAKESALSGGVGVLNEHTLHASVKLFLAPDADCREIPVGSRTADIVQNGRIFEVQTGECGALLPKLADFLPMMPVTLVIPVRENVRLMYIDPESGEVTPGRTSPKHGTGFTSLVGLYRIRRFLAHENLHVCFFFVNTDDYRVRSQKSGRGNLKWDTVPTSLNDIVTMTAPADYLQWLPPNLPRELTSADLRALTGCKAADASKALSILFALGIAERVGKKGRACIYRLNR